MNDYTRPEPLAVFYCFRSMETATHLMEAYVAWKDQKHLVGNAPVAPRCWPFHPTSPIHTLLTDCDYEWHGGHHCYVILICREQHDLQAGQTLIPEHTPIRGDDKPAGWSIFCCESGCEAALSASLPLVSAFLALVFSTASFFSVGLKECQQVTAP